MAQRRDESVPQKLRPLYEAIVARTDALCTQHLTDEYAQLCRQLAAALARKRPSPLTQGRIESWAAGIVYAIARVNFLFDPSQTPHLTAAELAKRLGVSQGTASARSKVIMDLFDLFQMDPHWTLPSKLADNPLVWMISVDGLIVDARYAPRPIQEEALRRGLIPYLP